MSIFGSILSGVFNRAGVTPPATPNLTPPAAGSPPPAPTAVSNPVDVMAVLRQQAAAKGGSGNWETSIVDLLKLLDLDSSLDARRQLANELQIRVGADGSAEQNIALHRAVMMQLFLNGGTVPASMRD